MHSVKVTQQSGFAFDAQIGNHIIRMDTADQGGTDSGASPKKLMLAALAGCTGIDIVSILDKMKVDYRHFTIEVTASLTETHPSIYKEVMITYSISVTDADKSKVEKAVALSVEKYCGVHEMFKSFATVNHNIIYV